jgi:hypothetical protein
VAGETGGWVLRVYEYPLELAFIVLFLLSWMGHATGGYVEYASDRVAHGDPRPTLTHYLLSARFWFESFQNWQSEFLAIASMVWLASVPQAAVFTRTETGACATP